MTEATYSYDEVPYESHSFPASHPDRLAAIGAVFGMTPTSVHRCRVLELGCASGGNLIPLAVSFPESQFVGVELSARQIHEARQTVEKLGLKNIELRQQNILEVDESLGQFDYVIAHGVFSWVPEKVQGKMLDICKHNLTPQGIGYMSYNTYPGWRMRGAIRDMILFHVRGLTDSQARIKQARALVKFLAKSATVEKAAYGYGKMLQDELNLLLKVGDYYVFHELLEDVNLPVYFYQFVEMLQQRGLQYVGEADFNSMLLENFPSKIVETLKPAIQDQVQLEQYLDFLTNRMFRSTLLCHGDVKLDRNLTPQTLRRVHLASPAVPATPNPDVRAAGRLEFRIGKKAFGSQEPLVKAAFVRLGQAWPQSVAFTTLVDDARWDVGDLRAREESEHILGAVFWDCIARSVVGLHSGPLSLASKVNERPAASALARLQAQTSSKITNQRHETTNVDRYGQICLRHLDGTRDRSAVLDALVETATAEGLQVQGKTVTDRETMRRVLGEQLPRCLEQLAKASLLVA